MQSLCRKSRENATFVAQTIDAANAEQCGAGGN
jgi:hypothetical protein